MSIFAIQNQICTFQQGAMGFSFPGQSIQSHVTGISYFSLTFLEGNSHKVQEFSASVSGQPLNDGVNVSVAGSLKDANIHQLDPAASQIAATCIAILGANAPVGVLADAATGVTDGSSKTVKLVSGAPIAIYPLLKGFHVSYPSGKNHNVQALHVAANVSGSDVAATATMKNDTGDNSDPDRSTIDANVLSVSTTAVGRLLSRVATIAIDDGGAVGQFQASWNVPGISCATAVLSSFDASWPENGYWLELMEFGVRPQDIVVNGNTVSLSNIYARYFGQSHYNASGNVTLQILAVSQANIDLGRATLGGAPPVSWATVQADGKSASATGTRPKGSMDAPIDLQLNLPNNPVNWSDVQQMSYDITLTSSLKTLSRAKVVAYVKFDAWTTAVASGLAKGVGSTLLAVTVDDLKANGESVDMGWVQAIGLFVGDIAEGEQVTLTVTSATVS